MNLQLISYEFLGEDLPEDFLKVTDPKPDMAAANPAFVGDETGTLVDLGEPTPTVATGIRNTVKIRLEEKRFFDMLDNQKHRRFLFFSLIQRRSLIPQFEESKSSKEPQIFFTLSQRIEEQKQKGRSRGIDVADSTTRLRRS